jgi:hypothetical protein
MRAERFAEIDGLLRLLAGPAKRGDDLVAEVAGIAVGQIAGALHQGRLVAQLGFEILLRGVLGVEVGLVSLKIAQPFMAGFTVRDVPSPVSKEIPCRPRRDLKNGSRTFSVKKRFGRL